MKKYGNLPGKRLAACLMACLLCFPASVEALAAEEELSSQPQLSSEIQEPSESEPSPLPEPAEEEAPAEDETGGESEIDTEGELLEGESAGMENAEIPLAANPLLVTGGHKTYMSGYPGALFKPNAVMTRSEAAAMLYNLLAEKPPVSQSKFPDVSMNQWYGKAVNALAEKKLIAGYTDGTFGPERPISRAEFVAILSRCFSMTGSKASFSDVPSTHWAYRHIAAATSMGWINGVGDGRFEPDRGIQRCEAVTVMNAALGRKDDGFAADRGTQKFKDVPPSHWAYLHITEAAKPVDSTEPEPPAPIEPGDFQVGQTVQVTVSSGLNLRAQPSTDAQAITQLAKGTILTVTDVSSLPWLGVKTNSGVTGYVHSGSDDGWYVENYTPVAASGASLSPASLSLRQYQCARLDGSVSSGGLSSMSWSSSDPSVAIVGYTINYGSSSTQGAVVYGKKPGTAVLTFSDATGKAKASCSVTVNAPEAVRYAYASENSAVKGKNFDLVAVTDPTQTSVTFKIISGPAGGSFTARNYTSESRVSQFGMPTNNIRVFKYSVAFQAAGTYTIRASAGNSAGTQDFEVFVKAGDENVNATSFEERRCSTAGLKMIQEFEGAFPEMKDDSLATGNPTVGCGYVVPVGGVFYNNLTTTELFALLVDKVNTGGYSSSVNRFRSNNNLKMSQAQFDALVCFVYNCGSGTLNPSSYDTPKVMLNAVAPPAGISESQSYPGTLNVTSSALYKEASLTAQAVTTVPKGEKVTVIGTYTVAEKKQLWYKARYGSKTGWIPAGSVQLDASGLVHDLAYADAATLSNNFMQWHKADGVHYDGLLVRRLAECKVFFFGDYAEASKSSPYFWRNTYGFNCPSCCAGSLD